MRCGCDVIRGFETLSIGTRLDSVGMIIERNEVAESVQFDIQDNTCSSSTCPWHQLQTEHAFTSLIKSLIGYQRTTLACSLKCGKNSLAKVHRKHYYAIREKLTI